jgi:hypothetical protein
MRREDAPAVCGNKLRTGRLLHSALIKTSDWILERPPQLAVFLFVPIMLRCVGRK